MTGWHSVIMLYTTLVPILLGHPSLVTYEEQATILGSRGKALRAAPTNNQQGTEDNHQEPQDFNLTDCNFANNLKSSEVHPSQLSLQMRPHSPPTRPHEQLWETLKQRPLANWRVVLSQVYGKTVTHQQKTNTGGQR